MHLHLQTDRQAESLSVIANAPDELMMCVRACERVCVTSVGAMRAPCQPEPAAASKASMATAVLPEPTSPCSRRIMGAGPCMSLKICTPQEGSGFRHFLSGFCQCFNLFCQVFVKGLSEFVKICLAFLHCLWFLFDVSLRLRPLNKN